LGLKTKAWLLAMALTWSCNAVPAIIPLTDRDCPEGAKVVGAAPPAGFLQRCELSGGVRHGKSRAWYDNGHLRYETEWWQGVKHGKFTLWYANGQKRAEGQDQHGIPDGKWTSWAENGTVTQEQVLKAPERAATKATP
jgi:MORN repeat variant